MTPEEIVAFDWDSGNSEKNLEKHGVSDSECEQVFFNRPHVMCGDDAHSGREDRYYSLGVTDAGRSLFVAFTYREDRIRVISARDVTSKERTELEHARKKEDTEIQE